MKKIIFIIFSLVLFSCEKENTCFIKYQIAEWDGCTQIRVTYAVNGEVKTELVNPNNWCGHCFVLKTGTARIEAEPTCPIGTVRVHMIINEHIHANGDESIGQKGKPAFAERTEKDLKKYGYL